MERIRLDIIPKGLMPVCHASQYDAGRVIRLDLMDGLQGYSLSDEEIELNVRKPDGHIVTASVDVVEGQTYVDIVTTEQMCAVEGENICELKISKDNAEIYSLNFKMMVEKSVTEGGDPSESFIHNLRTQIAEGVAEEVATQYDSANVIFDNAPTSGHGTPYTVTSEGIKTAIDNAFDYDNTASGSLVHIEDGADNIPVKSLISQIVATGGGGTPDAPIAISGFDSGVVSVCGKNLVSNSDFTYGLPSTTIGADINTINTSTTRYSYFGFIPPKATCVFSTISLNSNKFSILLLFGYKDNKLTLYSAIYPSYTDQVRSQVVDLSEFDYFRICLGAASGYDTFEDLTGNGYVQLELGNQVSTFEAYNGNTYTFAFGQTVYGGYFDNKGNLVVTHGFIDLGDLTWQYQSGDHSRFYAILNGIKNVPAADIGNLLCSVYVADSLNNIYSHVNNYAIGVHNSNPQIWVYDSDYSDANDFKTAMTGQKLVYELANPTTLAITSQDIPTLLGENNIFSNCGDVEVNYYTNKSTDILEFVNTEIGKKNGTNIPIEENSQDSIKDYIDENKADKTEDGTITMASGCTLISSSCGKTDRLVHLNFNVEKTGGFTTGWQVVGTTDFKPNTLAYCPLWNVTNGVGNGEVRIDTDGTINFYVVTAGEVRLNANIGYITS